MFVLIFGSLCSLVSHVSPQAIAQSFTLPPFGGAAPVVNAQQNIVVDTYNPSGIYSIQKQSLDCSDTIVQLCNQEAWTDFGLAISGIIPKNNLCLKYAPETSCLSLALSTCTPVLNNVTKTMMLAFARIVVFWCYDGGTNLNALETHSECLSMAMFDAMTTQGCLFDVVAPFGISQIAQKNSDGFQLTKLLNNLVGTYQSSTVICMKKSIEEACGKDAAELSLGPAMEELMPTAENPTTEILTVTPKRNKTKNFAETMRQDSYSSASFLIKLNNLLLFTCVYICFLTFVR